MVRRTIYVIVVVGVALRFAQYVGNRSLWIDEADVALNLMARSFGGLTRPLDFGQGAPIGFLFVEEAASRLFGFSEFALRGFPLLCGILSLTGFAWLAWRILVPAAAGFAVLLFAVADGLIYYSSEAKPYAGDVAASVGLLLIAATFANGAASRMRIVCFAFGGCALLVFSFPAVFVVAAIAMTLSFVGIRGNPPRISRGIRAAVAIWLLTSAAVAAFATSRLDQIRSANGGGSFLGVTGAGSVKHGVNVFATNLAESIGLSQTPPMSQLMKLGLLCVLVGAFGLIRRSARWAAILLIPFALALLAAALHAYPVSLRTELFLAPSLILLLAEGCATFTYWAPRRWKRPLAVTLAVALAAGPVYGASMGLTHPRRVEEIRPVLKFVRDHWKRGDTLYLHDEAQYAFLYYSKCNCLRLTDADGRELWPVRSISGSDFRAPAVEPRTPALVIVTDPRQYLSHLRSLTGPRRIWFLYTHVATPADERSLRWLVDSLGRVAVMRYAIDRPRAHAYLYELRSP
jgi:hypothetical protein